MKKLLAIIVLGLLFSGNANADWIKLSRNNDGTLYYNPESLTQDQGSKYLWILIDHKKELGGSMSRKVHLEIDCRKGKFKLHQINLYKDKLGNGDMFKRVTEQSSLGGWKSAVPGSTLYPILKITCN